MKKQEIWKVTSNPIGEKTMYRVYRRRDMGIPLHGGNVEYGSEYCDTRDKAQGIADKLNNEIE